MSNQQEEAIANALDGGVGWINTSGPIKLGDLKGKIVLLDFWTYCCINCHHILPDLTKLEQKYPNQLVVIGVHTAKFDAERVTENIRRKVNEYGIKHPVLNDANQEVWNKFNVQSWPTLVLIDPTGKYLGFLSGEGHYDILDKKIGELVTEAREAKTLNETPLHFTAESDKPRDTPLAFPGKVLADAASKRLFISDTANNRIVVTDLDGKFQTAIGTGLIGHGDGAFDKASFHRPQGMCLVGDVLYVADVENHMIRAIDFATKTVSTIAGTGEQSDRRQGGGPAKTTALNSPWDLVLLPGTKTLVMAMAGPHQLWKLDLEKNTVNVWAGNGREDIRDGILAAASFAQPSGLATDGKHVFVADSEGSAVRSVDLKSKEVRTLAGTHDLAMGQSLFAFGDKDGSGGDARLQHCLGVAFAEGKVYVADTYNNKIRVLDPTNGAIKSLVGDVKGGMSDDPPTFNEPGGVSIAGNTLYVADSNNGAIRAIDLKTNKVRTLALEGVKSPVPPVRKPEFRRATTYEVPEVAVAPGTKFTINTELLVPPGFKVSPDAPMPFLVEAVDRPDALAPSVSPNGGKISPPADKFPLTVELAKPAKAGDKLKLRVSVGGFLCKANSLCEIRNFVWTVPVTFTEGGKDQISLTTGTPAKAAQ